jgi:flagellar motor switch protein FliM
MDLKTGDVIMFDHPLDRPLVLEINGKTRFSGQVVDNGRKRAFLLGELMLPKHGERDDRQPLRTTVAPPPQD